MRGRVANLLRRTARDLTVGKKDVKYDRHSTTKLMIINNPVTRKDEEVPIERVTIRLSDCTRRKYKKLKKLHKEAAKKGLISVRD